MRFRISTLLLLIVVVGLALSWYIDRSRLREKLYEDGIWFGDKHNLWSPTHHLGQISVAELEAALSGLVEKFEGEKVKSSQGLGEEELRQPTRKTLDAVIALLDHDEEVVRLQALQLIALYLEAVSGYENNDVNSLETIAYFQVKGFPKVREFASDPNADVRIATALIFGNSLYSRDTIEFMKEWFENETDNGVKWKLGWAYSQISE